MQEKLNGLGWAQIGSQILLNIGKTYPQQAINGTNVHVSWRSTD